MTTTTNKRDVARTFLEAVTTRDGETLAEVTGGDFVAQFVELEPRHLLRAWDWQHLSTLLAEEFVDPQETWDRQQMLENLQDPEGISLQDVQIDELTCVPDDVFAFQMTPTYVHDGVYYGLPPTGETVPFPKVGALHVTDNRITEYRYMTSLLWLQVDLGVLPRSKYQAQNLVQYHQVVSRVLRHNLRNSIDVALGHLADATDEAPTDQVQSPLEELLALAEKTRRIENVIQGPNEHETVALLSEVQTVVDDVRDSYPDRRLTVGVSGDDLAINSNPALIKLAVREAVENAFEHAPGATLEVTVSPARLDDNRDAAVVTVADTGPGIPDHELTPLDREHEDALEHASRIGLWAIKWGVNQVGGDVEFAENDPQGTLVRLTFPNLDDVPDRD